MPARRAADPRPFGRFSGPGRAARAGAAAGGHGRLGSRGARGGPGREPAGGPGGGQGDVGRRLGELERRQAADIAGVRDEIRGIGGPR